MGDIRYCPACDKNVCTSADINWIIFIILLILGIILGVIYLVYCFAGKAPKCSVCGCKALQPPKFDKTN